MGGVCTGGTLKQSVAAEYSDEKGFQQRPSFDSIETKSSLAIDLEKTFDSIHWQRPNFDSIETIRAFMAVVLCVENRRTPSLTLQLRSFEVKMSAVCGPPLQSSAEEEVVQTFAVCSKKTTSVGNVFPPADLEPCLPARRHCWYITPPNIQIKSPTVPTTVECLSQIIKLITTVKSLLTIPRTVKPVAEIALRHENPKKEIANPNKHDNPTGKTTSKEYQSLSSLISCFIFFNSPITNNSNGKSNKASRLLYKTNPHVFNPIVITTCFI
ncbi:hypothetical protein LXL04_020988 [Taraxacum kok-saghyz]